MISDVPPGVGVGDGVGDAVGSGDGPGDGDTVGVGDGDGVGPVHGPPSVLPENSKGEMLPAGIASTWTVNV